MEHKTLSSEVKRADPRGTFEAVIATLGVVDRDGDVILPGAFPPGPVPIVPSHDHRSVPLGKATLTERGNEVFASGYFNLNVPAARDWHAALKFDLANPPSVQEFSFGFIPQEADQGLQQGRRVRFIRRMDVLEVSPVLRGAGVNTRLVLAKGLASSVEHATAAAKAAWPDLTSPPITFKDLERQLAASYRAQGYGPVLADDLAELDVEQIEIFAKALEQERQGLHRYVVMPAPRWMVDLAQDWSAKCCPLPLRGVYTFRPATLTEPATLVHDTAITGYCKGLAGEIYVRSGRSRAESLHTLGHELYHYWASFIPSRDNSEATAESYGARFASQMLLSPSA
ncbi:MAG: hypothetical protein ACOC9E_00840 [Chloroflexota bacterium]